MTFLTYSSCGETSDAETVILACLPLLQNASHLHPLRQRLFSSGEFANLEDRDVFTLFARHPYDFLE